MPSEPFPIYQVSRDASFGTETMGTKGKFWWRDDDGGHWLFKFGRPDTGEHWAEKVVAHFAELLQVPAARVELAECDGKLGTIGRSFADEATMVHGNELLQAVDSTYPVHEIYGVRDHTVQNVLGVLERVQPPATVADLPSAADWFVGYLLLDAITLNTDRHHENWAVLDMADGRRVLAPSYDHASSLGRELSDEERRDRLTTRDKRRNLEGYTGRARSGLYLDHLSAKACHPTDAFLKAAELRPTAAAVWLARLREVRDDAWREVIDRVPDTAITPTARQLATKLILSTTSALLANTTNDHDT